MATLPNFAASVVGSMPRSAFVKELISGDTPPDDPEYRRAMESAVRYVVALQEHAGIDVITDGEYWRKSYIGVIAELAHGFELSTTADGRPFTVVTGKLAPKRPGFIAQEARFLKTITNRAIKVTLPARPGAAGRAHVGRGEVGQSLPHSRCLRARLRAGA